VGQCPLNVLICFRPPEELQSGMDRVKPLIRLRFILQHEADVVRGTYQESGENTIFDEFVRNEPANLQQRCQDLL